MKRVSNHISPAARSDSSGGDLASAQATASTGYAAQETRPFPTTEHRDSLEELLSVPRSIADLLELGAGLVIVGLGLLAAYLSVTKGWHW